MKVKITFDEWYMEVNDDSTEEDINKIVLDTLMFNGIKNKLTLNVEIVYDNQDKVEEECVS